MVSVKLLRPYYMKSDEHFIKVILAYQYFSIIVNEQVYHFIPIVEKEIVMNRKTRKIVNTDALFAFQKGKNVIYYSMTELITFPDFLIQLYFIVDSYEAENKPTHKEKGSIELELLLRKMERDNIKRLIDQALDERDEEKFQLLVKRLKSH